MNADGTVGRVSRVARAVVEVTPPAPPFAPWSLPAALFLVVGIVLAYFHTPLFVMLAATVLTAVALFTFGLRWTLPFLLLLPVGFGRFELWDAAPNPVAALVGETVAVSGVSDGQTLQLETPVTARVTLSPKGKVKAGRVVLTGVFLEPAGKRNPGGFDYKSYLRRRGVDGQFLVDETVSFTPAGVSVKERLRRGVVAGLSAPKAALMEAMVLGVRDDLGDLRDIFSASGLAHVLALSGLHVGILVGVLGFVFRAFGLRRYPFLIVLVVGYVLLVGPTPSVVRAGAMTCAVLGSLWLGAGRIEPWPALALSVLVALLWNPAWLFDLSFQLSYLAVIGLLIFTEPVTRLVLGEAYYQVPWWHWKKLVVGSVVLSLSAQLLTLPLVASSFGTLPLLSPFVNACAIPLATALVPLGFFAGVFGLLSPALAGVLNLFTSVAAGLMIDVARLGSGLPNLIWGEVSSLGYAFFYVAVLALGLLARGWLRPWRALLVVATAGMCSAVSVPAHAPPEIVFIDVGQGDSALIRLPGRKEILMDGGGTPFSDFDVGKRVVVPALKALGVDELELVIASHSDTDHVEGLVSVLDALPVGRLVVGVRNDGDPVYDNLIAAAERNHVEVVSVVRGESLTLGDARLDILNPPQHPFEKDNDNSVTFVLNYLNRPEAIFMGDLPSERERGMAFPKVKVLMAGHHGSKHSTSDALLRAAQPETVVFSYGRNNYGHPNPDLVERVRATGATVYETFRTGAVRIRLE
ncbi:DNA internalization-related competence protein ComEC/Rec2 [soil metagenome]